LAEKTEGEYVTKLEITRVPRILIVDDDPDILKLAEQVLTHAGHIVLTASDAMKAMALLDQVEVDLLLSDANMPHYTGFDLVQTVRKNQKFKNISVAMLTSLKEKRDVEKAVRAGVDDYIVKPIDPLLLMKKIEALFRKKPPTQHPEVRFHQKHTGNEGRLSHQIHVQSISELGVNVSSRLAMNPGELVELQCELFENMGIGRPQFKVLSCQKNIGADEHQIQLIFMGASEALLQRVRGWIYSHGSLMKSAA